MLVASHEGNRAFGDYQYYLSFGGDQYFNMPRVIDSVFGLAGQLSQMSNWICAVPFELVGYTVYGNYHGIKHMRSRINYSKDFHCRANWHTHLNA